MADEAPAATAPMQGSGDSDFAQRLDVLFKTVRPKGGAEYSYRDVADGIRERGGPTISASYVWQLRTGVKDNPTKKHMEALADFFGVPAAYFFQDEAAARVHTELALLATLRDAGVRDLALRATGLSAPSLEIIKDLVERTRTLEGLNDRRRGDDPGQTLPDRPRD